jgi:hypothetical protein
MSVEVLHKLNSTNKRQIPHNHLKHFSLA